MSGNQAKAATLLHPPLPFFAIFIWFAVALSFKASLHQRFMMIRQNGCRESCSGVNWSVSARLKSVDSVACNSACQVA